MNKKNYIRPKMRECEHILRSSLCAVSADVPDVPQDGSGWDAKRRGGFYCEDTSQETGSLYQSQYENYY